MRCFFIAGLCLLLMSSSLWADGPADNNPEAVRRLPKLGIEVPADKRAELEAGLSKLAAAIAELTKKQDAKTASLLPDVQIFHKAVQDALKYQEFHDVKELDEAVRQLTLGQERAEQLLRGEAPWTAQTGLVVRGYVSKIDGSVQPYGMVVPETYTHQTPVGYRCDVWLHGRGETMTELNFIKDRLRNPGTFTPPRTLVVHPYGRWNNAFKFAGETDVFEALASAQQRYAIDEDRIAIRGFSMGGAGVWHLAVHYPDRWFAANPGAGFSETPEFLRVFQQEDLSGKPWWERKLWLLYDATETPANLINVPTIAYSGELDSQKQAADIMAEALKKGNIALTHIIGPETKHTYHPDAKLEVERRLAALAKDGRRRNGLDVSFFCHTLRYNRCGCVTIDELYEHFQGGVGECAFISLDRLGDDTLLVHSAFVTAFTLQIDPQAVALRPSRQTPDSIRIKIGGPTTAARSRNEFLLPVNTDHSLTASFHLVGNDWQLGKRPAEGLRKKHGLQGPIDDAFMDSFLMVKPTSKAAHEVVEKWTNSECERAIEHWRRHFRGVPRVKTDTEITEDDIRQHNLVLWGDPHSNAVLAKIADKLPIQWGKDQISAATHGDFAANAHAVIAIYPNPLNPEKYVVLNSGFTFRDYAHLNNARQVPMLPDWAVVDLRTPPGNVWPGKIVAADFFDEQWQLKAKKSTTE